MGAHLIVSNDIEEGDDVWSATEDLKDLDFSLDLLLLDWFEDFDDAFLVVGDVDAFKHFGILSPPNLPHNLVVIGVPVTVSLHTQNLTATKPQQTSERERVNTPK